MLINLLSIAKCLCCLTSAVYLMLNVSWTQSDVISNAIIPSYENEPCRMHWISVQKHHNPKWSLYLCCLAPSGKCKAPFTCRITQSFGKSLSSTLLFFTVCPVTKTPNTHTHTHSYHSCFQHLVPWTGLFGKFWVSWRSVISCPLLDHLNTQTHLLSLCKKQ